jgi:putative hemolysin
VKSPIGALLLCTVPPAFAALSACSSTPEPPPTIGMANPASKYCVEKGGTLKIVKEEAGEKGMCHFPDGTVIDEWELFRRDNPPK